MFDNPDDTARFFYLALLAMAIAVGLFASYRNRLGQAMQHLATWVLIFLGAVLVYGFSEELGVQLMPDRARITAAGDMELRRARDGHFYATLDVNGTSVRFLVDTGASQIVLSEADARAAGFEPERLDYIGRAYTANGAVRTAPVTIDRLALGDTVARDVAAVVNEGALDVSLLGQDFLRRWGRLTVEGDRLRLER